MSSYKNQHTVPQTYLKSWENSNNQNLVWYYNNLTKTYCQTNVDKILYEYYMYSLTLKEDLSIYEKHFLAKADFIDIFIPLKNYIVKYNDQVLNQLDDFADNYVYFEDWIIFDKNQKQISQSNKIHLQKRIYTAKSQRLEKKLSEIENKWGGVKTKIEKVCVYYINNTPISKHQNILSHEDLEYLKLFVDLQYSRTPKLYDTYLQTGKLIMNLECFDFILKKEPEIPARAAYLKMIDRGLKTNQFLIGQPLKNFNIKLLIASENQYFLTSDNPVFKIEDDNFNGVIQQKGIYIPITPKIIAVLFGKDNRLIVTKNIPDEIINSINQQIINNSQKGFISFTELKDTKYNKVNR
jgi:hypothetical protein